MNSQIGDVLNVNKSVFGQTGKRAMNKSFEIATVIHVGSRFAVLQFDNYRESFFKDELDRMVIGIAETDTAVTA